MVASENNEQQKLSESFVNSCYKIVQPILLQEIMILLSASTVVKHLHFEDVTNVTVLKTKTTELHISKRSHTF